MSAVPKITELVDKLDRLRTVTLTIYYNAEASPQMKEETGKEHSRVVSPNFLVMPAVLDEMDRGDVEMDTMRKLWLKARKENVDIDIQKMEAKKEETLEEKFQRLYNEAAGNTPKDDDFEAGLIKAAKFPIPSDYAIKLPEGPADLRVEIIETLVPFKKTREMLLRFENGPNKLDLPLCAIQIGHTRAKSEEELRNSLKL